MPKKKPTAPGMTTAIVPVTAAALAPIAGAEQLLTRLPGCGGTVEREKGVALVKGRAYVTADEQVVPASEIYFVDARKPRADGPWIGEADKVAWRDDATGLDCIMLREPEGFLGGYVGVSRDHPLWGWDHEAVTPDLGIEVHGGLTYSRLCAEGPEPRRVLANEAGRICHVRMNRRGMPVTGSGSPDDGDADAWWFGFQCNHLYDVVPGADPHRRRFMSAETSAEYRDDGYVVREIRNLAAQLHAIANGEPPPPRVGPPLPSVGLDPHRGG